MGTSSIVPSAGGVSAISAKMPSAPTIWPTTTLRRNVGGGKNIPPYLVHYGYDSVKESRRPYAAYSLSSPFWLSCFWQEQLGFDLRSTFVVANSLGFSPPE